MSKPTILIAISSIVLVVGASVALARQQGPSSAKKPNPPPSKYEAEAGVPKDKMGEKRRDYSVLEAALNDLAGPQNPEHKYFIRNRGAGRDILIHDKTSKYGFLLLQTKSRNIDNEDDRPIPDEVLADFRRRNSGPVRSLADFKPGNPDIIVRDLDNELAGVAQFFEKFPKAWDFVNAFLPAYSQDGKTAVVSFVGRTNGIHGLDWTYMLSRRGNHWEVQWRHLHLHQ